MSASYEIEDFFPSRALQCISGGWWSQNILVNVWNSKFRPPGAKSLSVFFSKYWFVYFWPCHVFLDASRGYPLVVVLDLLIVMALLLWLLNSILRGMGWGGLWEEGSGWRDNVYLWPIHIDVWQNPSQYCKVIILQLKFKKNRGVRFLGNIFYDFRCACIWPSTVGLSIGKLQIIFILFSIYP